MGVYLTTPITTKNTELSKNSVFHAVSSDMQGIEYIIKDGETQWKMQSLWN